MSEYQHRVSAPQTKPALYFVLLARWGILGLLDNSPWTCVRHFWFTVTDLVEWPGFLSAHRSMNSLVTFIGQIIFSLLCPVGFAFINQQGIQKTFLHTVTYQNNIRPNWMGVIVQDLDLGVSSKEFTAIESDTSLSGTFPTSVGFGKMCWGFFASLSLNWQIWFHCVWYWLTTSLSYMFDQRTRIMKLDGQSVNLLPIFSLNLIFFLYFLYVCLWL